MSRFDVKQFVQASSALRLEQEKHKQATKELRDRKSELRNRLKDALPSNKSFRAAGFVVTTLNRRSYRGITESMIRQAISEHWNGTNNNTNSIMKAIADLRKGPLSSHINVSEKAKTISDTPADISSLLEEYGMLEKRVRDKDTEYKSRVANLKATVDSFQAPVIQFMGGGGRNKRNITLSMDSGLVERWKLVRNSVRLPITKGRLQQALLAGAGESADDYFENVMAILDKHRKVTVKLKNPKIMRDYSTMQ